MASEEHNHWAKRRRPSPSKCVSAVSCPYAKSKRMLYNPHQLEENGFHVALNYSLPIHDQGNFSSCHNVTLIVLIFQLVKLANFCYFLNPKMPTFLEMNIFFSKI